MIFTQEEKTEISAAVAKAEEKTSGEIVPVLVAASADYSSVAYCLGIVGLLLASLGYFFWHRSHPFLEINYLFALQASGFFVGWILGQVPALVRFFSRKKHLVESVHEAALASFVRNGLHRTEDRTGILIYLSVLERRAEILADEGIHQKLGDAFWQAELDRIVAGLREGNAKAAFVASIQSMGLKLAQHFPAKEKNANELSDELRGQ